MGIDNSNHDFVKLLASESALNPGEQQRRAIALFPSLLATSRLKLWKPSEQINPHCVTVLLGIATFSIGDLKLLDGINKHLSAISKSSIEIRVYNTADDPNSKAFGGFFPNALRSLVCTPTFAVWEGGILLHYGCGNSEIRSMLAQTILFTS